MALSLGPPIFLQKIPIAWDFLFGLFGKCFDAPGTDFLFSTAHFFGLQVDAEFSKSLDIGVADFVAGLGAASANRTYFTHKPVTCSL